MLDDRPRTEDRILDGAEFQRFLRLKSLKMNVGGASNLQINELQALLVRVVPIVLVADLRDVDETDLLQRLLTLRLSEKLRRPS